MSGFAWRNDGGPPLLHWTGAPPGVRAAFSSRAGGVSGGPWSSLNLGLRTGDDRERVLENRRLLCGGAGVDPAHSRCLHQVHGRGVRRADDLRGSFAETGSSAIGDALWTERAARGLVAFGADCLTVVIARVDGSRIAAAHAGWPGLLAGLLERAAAVVDGGSGIPVVAAIGPSASPTSYEVGLDVATPLVERFGKAAVRRGHADLWFCGATALRSAGVVRVDVAGLCTIADDRFFSHRRTGVPRGVQGVVAHLEEVGG